MEELPSELVIKCFSFLDFSSVVACSQVCARWNELTQDNSLWRELYFRTWKDSSGAIQRKESWKGIFRNNFLVSTMKHRQTLRGHSDEALAVAFSRSGRYLATASRDGTCALWEVMFDKQIKFLFKLRYEGTNERPCFGNVCFTSDEKYFVGGAILGSIGASHLVAWSTETGKLAAVINYSPYDCYASPLALHPSKVLTAEEEIRFTAAGIQLSHELRIWDIDAFVRAGGAHEIAPDRAVKLLFGRSHSPRVHFATIWEESPDLSQCSVIFVSGFIPPTINQVVLCRNVFAGDTFHVSDTNDQVVVLQEKGSVVGLDLSPDKQFLLLNVRPHLSSGNPMEFILSEDLEVHLWDLKTFQLVGCYVGHRAMSPSTSPFCIYPHFNNTVIASGGECSNVYVWNREDQSLLAVLKQHSKCVNCVTWHPFIQNFLVSASDDHTVNIWF